MFDLKRKSLFIQTKLVMAVTIMVFASACAHEVLIAPANNDAGRADLSQVTPEPEVPQKVWPDAGNGKVSHKKSAKHTVAKHVRKAKKSSTVAQHKVKAHKKHIAAQVASVHDVAPPTPPAPPAPEIAPPSVPAPIASAAVQTEIDGDSGTRIGQFIFYGLAALAVLGLIYLAPRARRATKPKRKLVFNG